jgi:hypothetical protein
MEIRIHNPQPPSHNVKHWRLLFMISCDKVVIFPVLWIRIGIVLVPGYQSWSGSGSGWAWTWKFGSGSGSVSKRCRWTTLHMAHRRYRYVLIARDIWYSTWMSAPQGTNRTYLLVCNPSHISAGTRRHTVRSSKYRGRSIRTGTVSLSVQIAYMI